MTRSLSEDGVRALGRQLGRALPPGAVLWLEGDLGAGKTTLARAIVEGRGAADRATSPTFTLVHRYQAPAGPVFHVDCYRFRDEEEAEALDWGELGAGDLLIVEWPERGGSWVPPATHRVVLGHVEEEDLRGVELLPPPDGLDG